VQAHHIECREWCLARRVLPLIDCDAVHMGKRVDDSL
jgi:hypothetical protein